MIVMFYLKNARQSPGIFLWENPPFALQTFCPVLFFPDIYALNLLEIKFPLIINEQTHQTPAYRPDCRNAAGTGILSAP
jgi:hypothetical protein